MNEYVISVILGIIEGLTEFLPVSSTAHLRIAEALLDIDLSSPYWKMYTIVIQLGAILALVLLFLGRILEFVRTFPRGENNDRTFWNHPLTLTAAAFFFTSVLSLLSLKLIGKNLEDLRVMALSLLIGGVVMWMVDFVSVRREATTTSVERMTLGQAIWIGICQTAAPVFPGTSRSMSTIAAGQIAGMSRSAALEFSFLVSIPTMIAATAYDLLRTLHPGHHAAAAAIAPLAIDLHGWVILGIGFIVSFIVALAVVEWFLQWVRHHGFVLFALYRIALAIAMLVWGARLSHP